MEKFLCFYLGGDYPQKMIIAASCEKNYNLVADKV